ncbi:hypothetical protein FFK22_003825 [Mycobacterium sp. KBS0706]|uniref:EH signature domain-containing protein n=1 Tax=Mycobacterium sp. KBS0706 TaxID=2578109 RepID=UPI00110FAA63|nr:EH signature domain-containing protein [Mycobacterium sp. KBS0706]TSD89943.1 hypothetical protein FFK22_003825 [Mycobacterium sp. KBS0706]
MSLLDRTAALPSALPPARDPVRLVQAAERIRLRFGDRRPVQLEALDVLISRFGVALTRWDWAGITEGQTAQVVRAWAARIARLPAELEAFFLRELRHCTRMTLLGALCDGFLAGWITNNPLTLELGRIIQSRAAWLPRAWQAVFRSVPELLDIMAGAQTFGRWLAVQADPYEAALGKGISAPHGPGFMAQVHAAWLAALPEPTDEPAARRTLAWIRPAGAPALDGDRAAQVVQRLLRPWRNGMPPPALRALLLKVLTETYGDPRRDNPQFWDRVGEDGRRVMLRWLAGQRMEAFLDVVSRAEENLDGGQQWPARRRFWMGLYEQGRIDEAWPSFGADAQAIANERARTTGDSAYSSYGRQLRRKNISLLIMRIGRYVIVEGSHNFRVHVFRQDAIGSPRLYEDQYDVDAFILPDLHPDARRHIGDWMGWVRERIR